MEYIIQTDKLSHRYSKQEKILDNLSINVPKGSIYGFLGPNGAGKSTTMRVLTGIIPDDSLSVKIFGHEIGEQMPLIFERIGALVETPALYLHLSAYDNLRCLAKLKGVSSNEVDDLLRLVGLYNVRHKKVKQYSLGMKQRLAIAITLLGEPELLLLDEPVNGLDPNGIVEIRKLLVKINQERGVTIFISSHLLSEIEKMCTHVGIISKGKLRFEGSIDELSNRFDKCEVTFEVNNAEQWVQQFENRNSSLTSEKHFSVILNSKNEIPEFTRNMIQNGAEIFEIKTKDTLEDWFMNLTSEN